MGHRRVIFIELEEVLMKFRPGRVFKVYKRHNKTPSMNKIILAVISALSYALYNASIKSASGHINHFVGAVTLQLTAVLIGILSIIYIKPELNFDIRSTGLLYSILAGIFVGIAEIIMFVVFSKGLSISSGTAIVTGGTVVFGALIGVCFFKEALNLQQILGVLLVILGIFLLTK